MSLAHEEASAPPTGNTKDLTSESENALRCAAGACHAGQAHFSLSCSCPSGPKYSIHLGESCGGGWNQAAGFGFLCSCSFTVEDAGVWNLLNCLEFVADRNGSSER